MDSADGQAMTSGVANSWTRMTLGELISLRRGHDLTWRGRRDGSVPVMGSAGQNGFHDRAIVPGPGVVLGRSGASFGHAHYCESDFWPHNTALYVTDFRGNDRRFIYYLLSSVDFSRHNSGGAQQSLNRNFIAPVPIVVPSNSEQKRIVDALGDTDHLIINIKGLIAKKKAIKQGMMQRLLTGQTRLPGFTVRWSRTTVEEIGGVKTGPFGSALHEADYVNDGIPIITVEHLGERGIRPEGAPMVSESDCHRLRAYSLSPGDIVFSRVGSIDRNSLISKREDGWLFSGRLLRVRLDTSRADPAFISAQFHARPFREAVRSVAVGQTMPSLNTAILKGIAIDLPPLPEQKAIGKVVSDLDLELGALDERLAKTKAIKQGMMQELLTGHTRLTVKEAV